MITVSFPSWSDTLAEADLSADVRNRHRIIINWFLGYLKREHCAASVETAREFVDQIVQTRKPEQWQVEQWTDGLNWFFREAPSRRHRAEAPAASKSQSSVSNTGVESQQGVATEGAEALGEGDGRRQYPHTVAEMQAKVPMDPWYEETVRLMRVRQMAYRTEETYLGWIRRMERFLRHKDGLEAFREEGLQRFLSYLAVEEGVAAGKSVRMGTDGER